MNFYDCECESGWAIDIIRKRDRQRFRVGLWRLTIASDGFIATVSEMMLDVGCSYRESMCASIKLSLGTEKLFVDGLGDG